MVSTVVWQHDDLVCLYLVDAPNVSFTSSQSPTTHKPSCSSIALWERKLKITLFLCAACLGHWALLYRTMFIVSANYDVKVNACVVTQTSPQLLNVTFFFSPFLSGS